MRLTKKQLKSLNYTQSEIEEKNKKIIEEMTKKGINDNFDNLTNKDLYNLFLLIDESYFNNFFTDNFSDNLKFRVSYLLKAAGKLTIYNSRSLLKEIAGRLTSCNKETYEIQISLQILLYNFIKSNSKIKVSGMRITTRLSALLLIMQHELCHLLQLYLFDITSHNKQFKEIARNIFGHKSPYHNLNDRRKWFYDNFNKMKIGDNISFSEKGSFFTGKLVRINKNCITILLQESPKFFNKKSKCFVYIPFDDLKRFVYSKPGKGYLPSLLKS